MTGRRAERDVRRVDQALALVAVVLLVVVAVLLMMPARPPVQAGPWRLGTLPGVIAPGLPAFPIGLPPAGPRWRPRESTPAIGPLAPVQTARLTLAEATAQAAPGIKAPDPRVVGRPVSIAAPQPIGSYAADNRVSTPADSRSETGLVVTYANGLRFSADPRETSFDPWLWTGQRWAAFEDTAAMEPRVGFVNGRAAWVEPGGYQLLQDGWRPVPARVVFEIGRIRYELVSSGEGVPGIWGVLAAAESIR